MHYLPSVGVTFTVGIINTSVEGDTISAEDDTTSAEGDSTPSAEGDRWMVSSSSAEGDRFTIRQRRALKY